jgi:murein L,D-transpeptidase YafK
LAIEGRRLWKPLAGLALALVLAACQGSEAPKQFKPVPTELINRMKQLGMKETGQILIRIYKESSELEVWKEQADGRFAMLKNYQICKWSGILGPKVKEGDRQAPEGFYTVTPAQMNPKSAYYLSFNIGYPNAYDRSLGRTGTNLMVHGACSSAGCYSMTDEAAGELFALARDSFRGGQRDFQIQAYPFRMTAENMARHAGDPNLPFWKMLKVGADHFEVTRKPPVVAVCDKAYVFNADAGGASFEPTAACPPYSVPEWITTAVAAKQAADETRMAAAAAAQKAAAEKAAAEKAAADAKAAEKARRDAERAAQPSLISRIFGRGQEPDPATAPAFTDPAPAAAPVPPQTVGEAPVPKKKPKVSDEATASIKAPPAPKAEATPVPAAAQPAAEADTAAAPTEATAPAGDPPAGQLVKRKFLWPEDEAGDDPG